MKTENRGFDLISGGPILKIRRPPSRVRFIEVKGRSGVGEIALTTETSTRRRRG